MRWLEFREQGIGEGGDFGVLRNLFGDSFIAEREERKKDEKRGRDGDREGGEGRERGKENGREGERVALEQKNIS